MENKKRMQTFLNYVGDLMSYEGKRQNKLFAETEQYINPDFKNTFIFKNQVKSDFANGCTTILTFQWLLQKEKDIQILNIENPFVFGRVLGRKEDLRIINFLTGDNGFKTKLFDKLKKHIHNRKSYLTVKMNYQLLNNQHPDIEKINKIKIFTEESLKTISLNVYEYRNKFSKKYSISVKNRNPYSFTMLYSNSENFLNDKLFINNFSSYVREHIQLDDVTDDEIISNAKEYMETIKLMYY